MFTNGYFSIIGKFGNVSKISIMFVLNLNFLKTGKLSNPFIEVSLLLLFKLKTSNFGQFAKPIQFSKLFMLKYNFFKFGKPLNYYNLLFYFLINPFVTN